MKKEDITSSIEIISDSISILKRIEELGWSEFLKRIRERCNKEFKYFCLYLNITIYLLTTYLLAEEHQEILFDLLNTYAKELERYAVSVDLSITDEYYKAVKNYKKN